jgi:hypothetical protein
MPKRAWGYVAALGLTLASVGQAQEQADPAENGASAEQSPSNPSPFAIPVQIIESQESAEARERAEAEAAQREKDDLIAQQGMNEATQAMNEATQRMAFYALLATVLTSLGTGLLVWTLIETRRANKIAHIAYTVDQRPWISVEDARLTRLAITPGHRGKRGLRVGIAFTLVNTGKTPAQDVGLLFAVYKRGTKLWRPSVALAHAEMGDKPNPGWAIPPNGKQPDTMECTMYFDPPRGAKDVPIEVDATLIVRYVVAGDDKAKMTAVPYCILPPREDDQREPEIVPLLVPCDSPEDATVECGPNFAWLRSNGGDMT